MTSTVYSDLQTLNRPCNRIIKLRIIVQESVSSNPMPRTQGIYQALKVLLIEKDTAQMRHLWHRASTKYLSHDGPSLWGRSLSVRLSFLLNVLTSKQTHL